MDTLRIRYRGTEDMIPWDFNGKRYTFTKKTPIKEYPAEAINWLFGQRDRDWNMICEVLPAEVKTATETKSEDVSKEFESPSDSGPERDDSVDDNHGASSEDHENAANAHGIEADKTEKPAKRKKKKGKKSGGK